MHIAILGLGEAGSRLASDFITAGAEVYGWDPAPKNLPNGLIFLGSNAEAAAHAELIISVNWASVAIEVAEEVAPILTGQLYADINTSAPDNKRRVAEIIESTPSRFADVALMSPVNPNGIQSPLYVSGSGAKQFKGMMARFDPSITVIDDKAGSAATHKLVRSIMYKGVASVVMECLEAARKLHMEPYAREQMLTMLLDEGIIDRFERGSRLHAKRRMHEMEAVVELLESIGVTPLTSQASVDKLGSLIQ